MSDFLLKLGLAAIIFGVLWFLLSSGLPDGVLIIVFFGVAAAALLLGLRLRRDEPRDGSRDGEP